MSFLWTDMDDLHILLLIILGIIIFVVAVLVLLLIYCGKKLKRRGKTEIVTEKVSKNQIKQIVKGCKKLLYCMGLCMV